MLKISHLKKSFDTQEILRSVSFEAHDGQLTILEGQNGAGKSTLFNTLMGTIPIDGGQILLDDLDLSKTTAHERAQNLAILKQDPKASSIPSMNVWENCALAMLKNRRANLNNALGPKVKEDIIAHLSKLEIDYERHRDKPLGNLSGGQRQILAFAMAIIHKPRLLLLDEPTAALDDQSSHQLMKLIKKLVTDWNIPALMISHDHALNQAYADAIVVLQDGLVLRRR